MSDLPVLRGEVWELRPEQMVLFSDFEREQMSRWVARYGKDPNEVRAIRISRQHNVVRLSCFVRTGKGSLIAGGDNTPYTYEIEAPLEDTVAEQWMRHMFSHEPNPYPRDEVQEKAEARELGSRVHIYDSDGRLVEKFEEEL